MPEPETKPLDRRKLEKWLEGTMALYVSDDRPELIPVFRAIRRLLRLLKEGKFDA